MTYANFEMLPEEGKQGEPSHDEETWRNLRALMTDRPGRWFMTRGITEAELRNNLTPQNRGSLALEIAEEDLGRKVRYVEMLKVPHARIA